MPREIILSKSDYILLSSFIKNNAKNFLDNNLKKFVNEIYGATVVDGANFTKDIVKLNSEVSLLELENSNQITLTIVMPLEADVKKGKISVFAPLGVTLIGYKEGNDVEFLTPIGSKKYKILKVKNY